MILTGWTIELTHDATTYTATDVVGEDLVFVDKQDEDQLFFRRELNQPITFRCADFDWLYAIEQGADRCLPITCTITGPSSFSFEGIINLSRNSTKWDVSNSRVTVQVEPKDDYSCVIDKLNDEKNIIGFGTSRAVKSLLGELEENLVAVVSAPNYTTGLPDPTVDPTDTNWGIKSLDVTETGGVWNGTVTYVRIKIETTCLGGSPVAPPGSGWTLRIDDCAGTGTATYSKPASLALTSTSETTDDLEQPVVQQEYTIAGVTEGIVEIDNGVLLSDVLDFLITGCGYKVVSDFFDINPLGTAPSNAAYTAAGNFLTNLMIWQASDVRAAYVDAAQNATIGKMKLSDLLNDLQKIFRVYWWIDGISLRIEHESWFNQSNGLDLSADPQQAGTYQYERIDEDFPREQQFSWRYSLRNQYFEGSPLVYENACSDGVEENTVRLFVTDMNTLLSDETAGSDEGFVLGAAVFFEGAYYLLSDDNDGIELVNGHLSWYNLHQNYHQHRRPFLAGEMNGAAHTFTTAKRTKRQQVRANISTAQYVAFDPDTLTRSLIGWGEHTSEIRYSAKNCELSLTLLHT